MRRLVFMLSSVLLLLCLCGCGQKTVNYFGSTYEDASVIISKAAFENGSKNVVISASSQGIAMWGGTAFAGVVDAPVLQYENKETIDNEIRRLGAENVYIFGQIDYTPDERLNCVRFSSVKTVTEDAAKYLRESLGINYESAFLVTSNEEAAAVCSQAYKNKIPILFIDKKVIPEKIVPYLAPVHNYLVGEEYRDIVFDTLGDTYGELFGDSIADLSGFANNMFDSDSDCITLVKEPLGLAIAAPLAKKENSAVVYYSGELNVSQQKFMYKRSTDKVFNLSVGSNIDNSRKFKAESKVISNSYDAFNPGKKYKRAIFYIPHQDDETILFSQTILNAVDTYGAENVFAVLFSNGANSSAKDIGVVSEGLTSLMTEIKNKTAAPLSEQDSEVIRKALFSHARDNELTTALTSFGIPRENIRFIGLPDGQLPDYMPQIQNVMSMYKNDNKLLHFTFSPYYEVHDDHKALGTALMNTLGANADNAYFIVRYDLSVRPFFEEKANFALHRRFIFDNAEPERFKKAINIYNTYSVDADAISTEVANRLNNGESPADAVNNSQSVNELYLSVGFSSVRNTFINLSMRLESGNLSTTLHRSFVKD